MTAGGRDAAALGLLLAAIAGALITVYLTVAHYAGAALACVEAGPIDCSAVTSSSFSLIPGTSVPITIPGLAWFAASGVAAAIALRGGEPRWLRPLHLAWAAAATVVVLYLVQVELVVINRICEWCTALHVLIFASLLLALRRLQAGGGPDTADEP